MSGAAVTCTSAGDATDVRVIPQRLAARRAWTERAQSSHRLAQLPPAGRALGSVEDAAVHRQPPARESARAVSHQGGLEPVEPNPRRAPRLTAATGARHRA